MPKNRLDRLALLVVLLVAAGSLFALSRPGASAADSETQLRTAMDLSRAFVEIAKEIEPSVVSVSAVRRVEASPLPDFFERFGRRAPEGGFLQRGVGSGVIVSQDGTILTNYHVVGRADRVTVRLHDGREERARVVGTDEKTDLAVIEIEEDGLTPARLGDSAAVEVGEWVLAIGSPFGLDKTVTAGIISAKGRADVGIADYEDFLQTDAAINPGNSGGPLVTLDGKVIGINTAIASQSGGNMGVGFAIPANMARMVAESITEHGRMVRGALGVLIQDLDEGLARSFGYDSTRGALVADVPAGGPADRAGIRRGDIITRFQGQEVRNMNSLRNRVAATAPGTEAEVAVFRDGETRTLAVEIGELEGLGRAEPTAPNPVEDLGITVRDLTPATARDLGLDEDSGGAVVTEAEPGSMAAEAGLRAGEVIVAVGDQRIPSTRALQRVLAEADLDEGVRLEVRAEGVTRFLYLGR